MHMPLNNVITIKDGIKMIFGECVCVRLKYVRRKEQASERANARVRHGFISN